MVAVILAEKPSVAEDLARVLGASKKNDSHHEGNGLLITWAVGHLLELKDPEAYDKSYKTWKMDDLPIIPEEFQTKPKGSRNDSRQLKSVVTLMKRDDVDEIVNACDAAREGELIFRRILAHSGVEQKTTRMWLRSMTDGAIRKAWDERSDSSDHDRLGAAATSRAEADWIIGMNGSRAATLRLRSRGQKGSISLGRVQTPTLAMLVDKELEILGHVPSPYWELETSLSHGDATWDARWKRSNKIEGQAATHITLEDELEALKAELQSGGVQVEMTRKVRNERAPMNLDLTTLQKLANQLWNMSAKETLDHAQQLYERYKLTTYPRTESNCLPEDSVEDVKKTIKRLESQTRWQEHATRLGSDGLQHVKRNFNDAKVSDHHAIIPTGKEPPGDISSRTRQVYDLVVGRFLASFHENAEWEDEKRQAPLGDGALVADANRLIKDGWRQVIPRSEKQPEGWGVISDGAKADVASIKVEEGLTKPVSRLKDAGLLSRMENAGREVDDEDLQQIMKGKGLGTPATRAETIEKLISKGLAQRLKGGGLRATPDGVRLVDVVRHIPVEWITSPELTGEMESRLRGVEKGEFQREEYMLEIRHKVEELVERFSQFTKEGLFESNESVGTCRVCSADIIELDQRYACSSESCEVVYWKRSMGRYFDRTTINRLLENGSIEDLHGFVRRADSEVYSTNISLGEKGEVIFQQRPSKVLDEENSTKVGPCAICKEGLIRADEESFRCTNDDCTLVQGRRVMGKRPLKDEEIAQLINEGRTPIFNDFISKRGNPFSACIVLEETKRGGTSSFRAGFEFAPEELPEYEIDSEPLISEDGLLVKENATHFEVHIDGTLSHEIPRTVKDRQLSREECIEMVRNNQVGPLENFISAKGKPFKATLYLDARKQVKFRFERRRRKSSK